MPAPVTNSPKFSFESRASSFFSIGTISGSPSNPDYKDLRNSTGQGPMSRLPPKASWFGL